MPTCPGCGSQDAYIGFISVKCPARNCRFYSQDQEYELRFPVTSGLSIEGFIKLLRRFIEDALTRRAFDQLDSSTLEALNTDLTNGLDRARKINLISHHEIDSWGSGEDEELACKVIFTWSLDNSRREIYGTFGPQGMDNA